MLKQAGIILKDNAINLDELVTQIQKDMQLSGLNTSNFDNMQSITDFINRLQDFVSDLITHRPADFDRLMYRVDIYESNFNQILNQDFEDLVAYITLLILKREVQKIVFRKQYGS